MKSYQDMTPKERKTASKHYRKLARQANRQRNRNELIFYLFKAKHFSIAELFLTVLIAALMGVTVYWLGVGSCGGF